MADDMGNRFAKGGSRDLVRRFIASRNFGVSGLPPHISEKGAATSEEARVGHNSLLCVAWLRGSCSPLSS